MSVHFKSTKHVHDFIKDELARITQINSEIDILSGYPCRTKELQIINQYVTYTLLDSIDLHKHLILKAISIVTGFDVDDVYDSNILLKDKDINTIIYEFIESTMDEAKEVIEILEKKDFIEEVETRIGINDFYRTLQYNIGILSGFIPEMKIPGELSYDESSDKIQFKIKKKEYAMLNILEKINYLKENNLFKGLKTNELIPIANITNEIEISDEETFIDEGEIGDELFIILEGMVQVYTEKKMITTIGPGSCIGELSVIDAEPRSTNVKTIKKSRFLSIKRKDFLLTLRDNPTISINIMKILTQRVRNTTD